MTIGQRIKNRRKELHLTADDLAEKLGKDRSTIYRYENGDIGNFPTDILEPLAKILKTTPAYEPVIFSLIFPGIAGFFKGG